MTTTLFIVNIQNLIIGIAQLGENMNAAKTYYINE